MRHINKLYTLWEVLQGRDIVANNQEHRTLCTYDGGITLVVWSEYGAHWQPGRGKIFCREPLSFDEVRILGKRFLDQVIREEGNKTHMSNYHDDDHDYNIHDEDPHGYWAPTVETIMLPCKVNYHPPTDTVYGVVSPGAAETEELLRQRRGHRYQYITKHYPIVDSAYPAGQTIQDGWELVWSDKTETGTFVVYRKAR